MLSERVGSRKTETCKKPLGYSQGHERVLLLKESDLAEDRKSVETLNRDPGDRIGEIVKDSEGQVKYIGDDPQGESANPGKRRGSRFLLTFVYKPSGNRGFLFLFILSEWKVFR